jgi:hypothetical protein
VRLRQGAAQSIHGYLATNRLACDLCQLPAVPAGVTAKQFERRFGRKPQPGTDCAFRLLDEDPAVQRELKLPSGFRALAEFMPPDAGGHGELHDRLRQAGVRFVEHMAARREHAERSERQPAASYRQRRHRANAGAARGCGEIWPYLRDVGKRPVKNTLSGTAAVTEGTPAAAAGDDLIERWPRYGPAAAELGVYSVSAAPLAVPSARLGAVCAYDREPAVRQSVVKITLEVAEALTQLLLTAQRTDLGAIPNTALLGMFEARPPSIRRPD